ncbi:histidine kinase [Pseudonocardia sp. CA-107938]|uniref:sensor histidine kinase n=1 Tax=Pseudonocardia sp. CA-107938 TaxID=3240021 RepID=UPI003D89BF07
MTATIGPVGRRPPDLATLTGVRSGKRTFYQEFQRSNERLKRTVAAMDSISRALVRTVEGPRALLEEILRTTAEHVQASWTALVLVEGQLADARPRLLVLDPHGVAHDSLQRVPAVLRGELEATGCRPESDASTSGWLRVPMMLGDTQVGALACLPGFDRQPDEHDLAVLRTLANHAAVALHTASRYTAGIALERRARYLYDEVTEKSRTLLGRTAELRAAEQRLRVAHQRELIEDERRRIALELHDSVAQTVLTAGLALDVLRHEVAELDGGALVAGRLSDTKELMATATEQLRSVIYALHHTRTAADVASLPELLAEMAQQHRPHLSVRVCVDGRPVPLGCRAEHALARTAGEALFNVAMHAHARRAQVRLRYRPRDVQLWISDDGSGDPAALRRKLRLARSGMADGRHRGLVGMAARAESLGGTFRLRRARSGGIRVEICIPRTDDVGPGVERS